MEIISLIIYDKNGQDSEVMIQYRLEGEPWQCAKQYRMSRREALECGFDVE